MSENELCSEGQDLWNKSVMQAVSGDYSGEAYKVYVKHIMNCEECQKKLGGLDVELLKEFYVF